MEKVRPALLIILDGFGINSESRFNAIKSAKTPTLDRLFATYPNGELDASESQVGLPSGFMGNSEVGHLNIGAGRIVYQDFSLISHAIEDGSFFKNEALLSMLDSIKKSGGKSALHLMGLVSDGGVHSHVSHLFALIKLAKERGIQRVVVHAFTDGRDTSPVSGVEYLRNVRAFCADAKLGEIGTLQGRFYAMDRDKRWERTEKAYQAIVNAKGQVFSDPIDYLIQNYEHNVTDEFIPPGVLKTYRGVRDGDAVCFFNFRADRARQLTSAMTQTEFTPFRRENFPTLSAFVTMTSYEENFGLPVAYQKPLVPNTLGEIVALRHWKQLRIAETEKYAHVTYFFNGGEEKAFEGEKRILIPSPREVKTYDQKPEMSAPELTDRLMNELNHGDYQFVVVNFANPDMVGHTGNFTAAVRAIEVVDTCLKPIVEWVESHHAFAILTSDHGNCELMQDMSGLPLTSHTLFRVPYVIIDPGRAKKLSVAPKGRLCDLAPTLLDLWGIKTPSEMTGRSLIDPAPPATPSSQRRN